VFSVFGIFLSLIGTNLFFITLGNIFSWAGMDMFFSMKGRSVELSVVMMQPSHMYYLSNCSTFEI
jgi:hypothetical protein